MLSPSPYVLLARNVAMDALLTNVTHIYTFGYMGLVNIWTFYHKHYAAESSSKADCHLVCQEISCTFEKRKLRIMFTNTLSLVLTLSHINADNILTSSL